MIDPELEAIHKCTELLRDLDEEAKIRVLQYLINRFNLTTSQQNSSFTNTQPNNYIPQNVYSPQSEGITNPQNTNPSSSTPTYKAIAIKGFAKTEVDWVLIYCFVASHQGENHFTRNQIIEEYQKSNRWSQKTSKGLSNNFNAVIKKDWIKPLNDNDYVMQEDGLKYVYDIFSGNSISKSRGSKSRTKKAKIEETE